MVKERIYLHQWYCKYACLCTNMRVHIHFTHRRATTMLTSMSMCVDVVYIYIYLLICVTLHISIYVVYKCTFIHSSLIFYHLLAQTITWHCDDASLFQQLQAPKTCKKPEAQEMFFWFIFYPSNLHVGVSWDIYNPLKGKLGKYQHDMTLEAQLFWNHLRFLISACQRIERHHGFPRFFNCDQGTIWFLILLFRILRAFRFSQKSKAYFAIFAKGNPQHRPSNIWGLLTWFLTTSAPKITVSASVLSISRSSMALGGSFTEGKAYIAPPQKVQLKAEQLKQRACPVFLESFCWF